MGLDAFEDRPVHAGVRRALVSARRATSSRIGWSTTSPKPKWIFRPPPPNHATPVRRAHIGQAGIFGIRRLVNIENTLSTLPQCLFQISLYIVSRIDTINARMRWCMATQAHVCEKGLWHDEHREPPSRNVGQTVTAR